MVDWWYNMVNWVIRGMICLALILFFLGEFIFTQKGLFDAGVALLILTPIIRVAVAGIQFGQKGDYLYLIFSFFILSVIGIGFLEAFS